MMSNGKFGAITCLEGIQNPVDLVQRVLLHPPHILIVGEGARIFAEEQNIPVVHLSGPGEKKTHKKDGPPSCNTVCAVAVDGTMFAAALNARNGMAWSHLTEIK